MITKSKKSALLNKYISALENYKALYFIKTTGVKANEIISLRKELKKNNADVLNVKNTIMKLVFQDEKYQNVKFDDLKGQYSLIISYDEPDKSAKMIKERSKKNEKLIIDFGYLQNNIITSENIVALADLPPKEVLIGRFMGTMTGVISNFMNVMNGNTRKFMNVLNAKIEKENI